MVQALAVSGSDLYAGGYFTTAGGKVSAYIARAYLPPLPGSLTVTLSPAGAVNAGAQWQVDSGAWQNGGAVVTNLSPANHTVSFSPVAGWNTPGNQIVSVSADSTSFVSGIYTPSVGALQITINPAGAVSAGAQWQVDGGAFQNSGAVVPNLALGNHTVSFSPVAGWTAPANQTVAVTANSTNAATGTYTPNVGALQVTISPVGAVSAGAQWQVDGGTFQNSGAVVAGLPAGNHTVTFSTVSGWVTPGNQTVAVSANTTNTATGTYTANSGAFQVTINPAGAVSAGAQWQVDGGAFQNSGAVVGNLSAGNHTLTFSTVGGWVTPGNQIVAVSANVTNAAIATYTAVSYGALQVTINPAGAVGAGAQWQVDGGPFRNSGAVVTNLPAGNHTVAFSTVSGWLAPGNQIVAVSANITNAASGTYAPNVGGLQVTISPAGAVGAGAQWQVDGGTLQSSGAVVTNLPAGNHTLAFSAVSGWVTPGNQTAAVSANATNAASGTYVVNIGALQVTINPPAAVSAGAQWQVDGGPLQNSGAVVPILPVGAHIVAFSYVSGWDTPANQTVAVSLGSTNTASTTYHTNSIALKTWSGVASTDWFNPLNWTPFGVPGPSDTVVLNNGGTITLSAPVTHNGVFNWSAGGISGGPNPLTLGSNAVMTLSGSASHGMANCILTNNGMVVWSGGDIWGGGIPGTVIYNHGL